MNINVFSSFLKNLRRNEEVILFQKIFKIAEKDRTTALNFLQTDYKSEGLNFPHTAPEFDTKAAFWAAKTIYIAAQLILYREHQPEDLKTLIPDFGKEITPSAILSADLCLRFLPDMISQLKMIDSEDELIPILEKILSNFHYSGINFQLEIDSLDFKKVKNNACLLQLYVNRIIESKNIHLANHPAFREAVAASLSIYKNEFWAELKFEKEVSDLGSTPE